MYAAMQMTTESSEPAEVAKAKGNAKAKAKANANAKAIYREGN